jgi:hypothetical protein
LAGKGTEVTVKAAGETARGFAKLNQMMKNSPMAFYQAWFNFAVRYK